MESPVPLFKREQSSTPAWFLPPVVGETIRNARTLYGDEFANTLVTASSAREVFDRFAPREPSSARPLELQPTGSDPRIEAQYDERTYQFYLSNLQEARAEFSQWEGTGRYEEGKYRGDVASAQLALDAYLLASGRA